MKIFLSYARKNKDHMQGIKKALSTQIREKKITLWIDEEKLKPTEKFDATISKRIKESDMVLLLLSLDFWSSDYIQEKEFPLIMQEYQESGLLLFPIVLEDIADFSEHKELDGILAYPFDDNGDLTPIVDFGVLNRAYNKIAIGVKDIYQKQLKNPYKHLSYFEQEDSPNFYGRERIAKELASNTLTLRASLLFGESGVGKTSLILAGVLNELNKEDSFRAVYIRFRKDVIVRLRDILAKELSSDALGVEEILENYMRESGKRVLLIFDQFEEIFTTVEGHQRDEFFSKTLFKITDISGVHTLFSLRADFLWCLNPYRDDFDGLWNKSVGLERLGRDNALKAISNPLESEMIDDALAEKIYQDLLEHSRDEQVYTPFLQLVMFEIYKKAIGRNSLKITQKLYEQLGGVSGIVRNYFDGLLKKFNADEHKRLEKLFFYLVTDSYTRGSLKKSELEEIFSSKYERKRVYNLIDVLIRDRVVRRVTDIDEYYELVHDILAEHISKRFDLRQNIKHLTNRLEYLAMEEPNERYLSEKDLYEILIYREHFDWKDRSRVQTIRSMIKYHVGDRAWIEENLELFYRTLFEFLESEESGLFLLGLKATVYYRDFIDKEQKERVYQRVRVEKLNNNDSQSYWILTLLFSLEIEPTPRELSTIGALASNFNSSWEIKKVSIRILLKYSFDNKEFIDELETKFIFEFVIDNKESFIKEILYTFIDNFGIDKHLEYIANKLEVNTDIFDEHDDGIINYTYSLFLIETMNDYLISKEIELEINPKNETVIKLIVTYLLRLHIIVSPSNIFYLDYQPIFKRLEDFFIKDTFLITNISTNLLKSFIDGNNRPELNKQIAFKLAKNMSEKELKVCFNQLKNDNDISRQNAYMLLYYRFDDVLEMDLDIFNDTKYDEINLFINFDRNESIFNELTLSNKDIQIKRLEQYFNLSVVYTQFEVWESYIDVQVENFNRSIVDSSLKIKEKNFQTIKSGLKEFLLSFDIELMFDRLLKNSDKSNIQTLSIKVGEIKEGIIDYQDNQLENQKQDVNALVEVIEAYGELEKLDGLEFLDEIRADISFMEMYIEAKNLDIALDYWLDYITDMVSLLVKEDSQGSMELKEKLLQKMIRVKMYDNVKILFRDGVSKRGLDEGLLESEQDWHIYDTLLECCYDLRVDVSLHLLDRFLSSPQVRIRQFAFQLLGIHSQVSREVKRDRAFKFLENSSLRLFALELLAEVGEREDILKLIEFRGVQDVGFQEKLGWCLEGILENQKYNEGQK